MHSLQPSITQNIPADIVGHGVLKFIYWIFNQRPDNHSTYILLETQKWVLFAFPPIPLPHIFSATNISKYHLTYLSFFFFFSLTFCWRQKAWQFNSRLGFNNKHRYKIKTHVIIKSCHLCKQLARLICVCLGCVCLCVCVVELNKIHFQEN